MYFAILLLSFHLSAQATFKMPENVKKETIKFKLINNLIIIPVEVNGVELSFILDTGVNKPILFNVANNDSIEVKNIEEIFLRGLGEGGAIRAFHSKGNNFKLKSIYNNNQDLYVVLDEKINFSPRLGIPVHGIIGFDLVRDFVLDINYVSKKIRFYKNYEYTYKDCKKCEQFDIELYKNKPYLNSKVQIDDNREVDVKLLIDSGSSDALWLFENEGIGLKTPKNYFEGFLGRGLSGGIYGNLARAKNFSIGNFNLKDTKVSFPDSVSIRYVQNLNGRNGSLGSDILKRFRVILDYQSKKITLKKNNKFNTPFKYNMSGLEVQHNGIRYVKQLISDRRGIIQSDKGTQSTVQIILNEQFKFSLHPAIEISEVRQGSPAGLAGLKEGDVLLTINGKQTFRYNIQEINELLNERAGKKIKLTVDRQGTELRFFFVLKRVL